MSPRSSASLLQAFSITAGCSDASPPACFSVGWTIVTLQAFLPVLVLLLLPPASSSGWSVAAVWTEETRTVSLSPQLPPGLPPNWSQFSLSGHKLEQSSFHLSSCIWYLLALCFNSLPPSLQSNPSFSQGWKTYSYLLLK